MRLPKFLKLSKVVSKDGYRPILTCAFIREEDVEVIDTSRSPINGKPQMKTEKHLIAYATNSYAFTRVDLGVPNLEGEEGNVPGPIPLPALQHMERGVQFVLGEKEIRAGITGYDRVISEDLHLSKPEKEESLTYPDWHQLYPEFSDNVLKVGVSPKLLYELAQGMGMAPNEGIVLEVDLDKVKPIEGDGEKPRQVLSAMKVTIQSKAHQVKGMIMPIRVNV